jgi:hypothetical protein
MDNPSNPEEKKRIMRKLSQLNQMLGLGVAALLVANQARATVSYQINSGGLETFNVAIDAGQTGGATYNGALAGGIAIHQTTSDSTVPINYVTVCTDIQGTLYLGSTYTYNLPVSFGTLNGVNPRWGSDNYGQTTGSADAASAYQAIQNAAELFYTHYSVLSGASVTDKAALQLAVWAALYNTDKSGQLTGTRFTFSGGDAAAVTEANTWLGLLITAPSGLTYTGDLFVPNPLNQNGPIPPNEPPQELLYAVSPLAPIPGVPEATTMIAGVLLLLPFGSSIIRILRKVPKVNKDVP